VRRGVHLHELAEAGSAWPTLAMRIASALALPQPFCKEPTPQCVGRHGHILLGQLLARQGWAEAHVALAILAQGTLAQLGVELPIGGSSAQAMHQAGITLLVQAFL
jgi:hypothetical protein